MATEDCMELLSSGSQLENVENDLYCDVNSMSTSITSEKNGEAFQTALEDDKEAEGVSANAASEMAAKISMTMVDGHEKLDELGDNNVENDKKAEAINSSSNKETKKILRKRKKNVEDVSAHTVPSPPKSAKKKVNDVSAMKIKEVPPRHKSTEDNEKKEVKSDEELESIGKAEDEVGKADDNDVKIGKKVEGTVSKVVKIAKKKISVKAKGESSNAESAPTNSPNVAAVEATCSLDEKAKQNVEIDENLASATKNAIPAIEEKDAEGTKGKNIKKKEKRVTVSSTSSLDADKVNNADKPTPAAKEKDIKKEDTEEKQSNKVDGMGLIFMCNGKTKKDCFKYHVFGLPESKKALVAKIYKGMRLFLFDFDLKLLYGIYKAASPGGYNIEPKAFDSKFQSQVRFTVLRDCIPLPEEKFKAAIKENYTTRNKFDCQLSPEQVNKLCKLFQSATASGSMQNHRPGAIREVALPRPRTREPKRRHVRRGAYPSPPRFRRRSPPPPPRARFLSPPPRALPLQVLHQPLPAPLQPTYTYERPSDDYYFRRDHRSVLDLEMRPRDLSIGYHDPYNLYREPVVYREPPVYLPSLPSAYASQLREPRSPPRYLY